MRRLIAVLVVVAAVASCSSSKGPDPSTSPPSEETKALYALGHVWGTGLGGYKLTEVDLRYVTQGLNDAVLRRAPPFALDDVADRLRFLARERLSSRADAVKAAAAEFLKKAAAEPGARVLPSGLVFRDMQAGTGATPRADEPIRVHYRGTLADGTEFDSSHKRGKPVDMILSKGIRCWVEGVALMKVGGKAALACPADLAYGDEGSPPAIPGNAALSFEIELVAAGAAATKATE